MTSPVVIGLVAFLVVLAAVLWARWRRAMQVVFIREYKFPYGLFQKLDRKRPGLGAKEHQLVARALRQFFIAYQRSGCQFVAMPSQIADDLWHEFILYTREYEQFCRQAFGDFLHHTPAVAMGGGTPRQNAGLRRVWWFACLEEDINPRKPTRLPLLFALDAKLGIADGFTYAVDCTKARREEGREASGVVHCGGDFADGDFDGSLDGFGDAGNTDGGSADAVGDVGVGCGGGGCGGGD